MQKHLAKPQAHVVVEAVVNQELGSLGVHSNQEWSPPSGSATGEDVLKDVIRLSSSAVGDRLLAAYALGSLAHGGFSASVSDVDVGLILADPIQPSDTQLLRGLAEAVRSTGSPLHSRVSIFWGTPDSLNGRAAGGRFPPLDRLCLFEHGRLLMGSDRRDGLSPPSQTDLLVAGAQFALDALSEDVLVRALEPDKLVAAGLRWATKVILFPARFVYTADTGREGTNEAAVQHYSALDRAPSAELVRAALDWRSNSPSREQAAKMLKSGLVPLYDFYLTDHIDRLQSIGEPELADAFRDWRSRLLAIS
jgi:hypothetical protein